MSDPQWRNWIDDVPLADEVDPLMPVDEYPPNDYGMACAFVDRAKSNIHWLNDYRAWLIYDGNRWHVDEYGHISELFNRAVVKRLLSKAAVFYKLAVDSPTSDGQKKFEKQADALTRLATNYGNDGKIKAVLSRLSEIPGIGMKFGQLNWNKTLLALPNGQAVSLTDPNFRSPKAKGFTVVTAQRESFLTLSTRAVLREMSEIPESATNHFSTYLDTFLPDRAYRRFVQKSLGHALIGGNPEKLSIWLHGDRDTGKSTLLNLLLYALGDYASAFSPSAVLRESNSNLNPELGNLLFKRVITSTELGGLKLSAEIFKQVTGCDQVSITRKHANEQITGSPHFTMVVATNRPPRIANGDGAFNNRIMVLPFDTRVTDSHNWKNAQYELPELCAEPALRWLLLGYRRYLREGLNKSTWPQQVKTATNTFLASTSDVNEFLSDNYVRAFGHNLCAELVFARFQADCPNMKMSKTELNRRVRQQFTLEKPLEPRRCRVHGTKSCRSFIGLKSIDAESISVQEAKGGSGA